MIGVALLILASATAPACDGQTTLQVNACLAQRLAASEARLRHYLKAARDRAQSSGDPTLTTTMKASEKAFKAYRNAECTALFDFWKGGTIRGTMELDCRIGLTTERTHAVWQNWLRYPDSTPPILPEPPTVQCEGLRCDE